ncbi:MarR family winged helix-turn-helix transcriptional regulator [Desulfoscipio sp. XC116]|uniref:MarR family winged helix-turn-helix transcriptional regulator n=1 Tax=Desulfoscipio sp. XC116 TaxID=3144975 RepID=UPI00325A7FDA
MMLEEDRASKELVEHLLFLHRALRHGVKPRTMADGYTIPQRIVMGYLFKFDNLSVKELSQQVGLSHSTISGIVDRLERKGLVTRIQDSRDRRITKVSLTDLAKNYFNSMMTQRMFSGVLGAFNRATAGEQMKILEGLRTLRELLGKDV